MNELIENNLMEHLEKDLRLSQDTKDYLGLDYYEKLKALLDGLEIEHIEELLRNGDINTYQLLGKMIALKTKELKNE